jgi:hypothetical protein
VDGTEKCLATRMASGSPTINGHAPVYRKPADGSGAEEILINDEEVVRPTDWSQDGKCLIYRRGAVGNDSEIWALPLEGEPKPGSSRRVLLTGSVPKEVSPLTAIGSRTHRPNPAHRKCM